MLADWVARDAKNLWHPYASATTPPATWHVSAANGVRLKLTDADGATRWAIDGMASWWCMVHGYKNPHLDAALHAQIDKFSHVMFGGLTHDPAILLGEALVERTGMDRVFLADSGSVAVEVALKMAVQYQAASASTSKRGTFMTVRGGYHGDTTGAMSVCDPEGGMHSWFTGLLAAQVFTPQPPRWLDAELSGVSSPNAAQAERDLKSWADEFRRIAHQHRDELAGLIVEPVLQGAGGMFAYDPRCLQVMREVCDELDLVFIADEIATGFGRTGTFLALEHAGVTADILCLGKALTGGYMTLAATLCTDKVALRVSTAPGTFTSGNPDLARPSALMHGPTFMGNPLACAVALASLELLAGWHVSVQRIEKRLRHRLADAPTLPQVSSVRVLGAVGVIELDRPVDLSIATRAALDAGVWLRPFRNLIYAMPPYISSDSDIDRIAAAMICAAEAQLDQS